MDHIEEIQDINPTHIGEMAMEEEVVTIFRTSMAEWVVGYICEFHHQQSSGSIVVQPDRMEVKDAGGENMEATKFDGDQTEHRCFAGCSFRHGSGVCCSKFHGTGVGGSGQVCGKLA